MAAVMLASLAVAACSKQTDQAATKAPPRVPVLAGEVVAGDAPLVLNAVGTAHPVASVMVKPQVNGQISEVHFQEGQDLKAGDLPNVDFPTISVSASLPGANPETMASSIATPLEKQFSTIAARGVGIDEIRTGIQQGNSNLPTGTLDGRNQTFTVKSSGQLLNAKAFEPLIVTYRDGAPVRLEEIAKVSDSVENDRVASWYRDRRAIVLAVQRQPGTNTVAVMDGIRKTLPSI